MNKILNFFYADSDNQLTITTSHTQLIELIVPT